MSAVHELVLQPEYFHMCEVADRPTAKAGFMADELFPIFCKNNIVTEEEIIKASDKINYYKGKMNEERIEALRIKCEGYYAQRIAYEAKSLDSTPIYLDPKSRERVRECVQALGRNKSIQDLLHPKGLVDDPISENEQAILLDVQVQIPNQDSFILRIKSKLDNYTIDQETGIITVNDVKTIGKILSEFQNNFDKFRYYRELAIYCWLMSLVAKKYYNMENCTIKSNCLVVSTIPNYYTKVYPLKKSDFKRGWEEFKFLLRLVAYYYNKGYRFK